MPTYVKAEHISLKDHPDFDEKWVQKHIEEDPALLGLGDVILRDRERVQPKGRLDLLLQDRESKRRYEVELQLGPSDGSHIIRTLEYWDVERKRHPEYEHVAVLVAEDVTSRFLDVVGLFNGSIPIIAIQMSAIQIGDKLSLVFTTVLDEFVREADEESAGVTTRDDWKQHAPDMLPIADRLLEFIHTFEPKAKLSYTKLYIGLTVGVDFRTFRASCLSCE